MSAQSSGHCHELSQVRDQNQYAGTGEASSYQTG